jgi:hypothetical protein
MTSVLLHDVASTMQGVQAAVDRLQELGEEAADPSVQAACADIVTATQSAVNLFVAMRKFVRRGELSLRPTSVASIFQHVEAAWLGTRSPVPLAVAAAPDAVVSAAEPILVHALCALARDVATGGGAAVRLTCEIAGAHAELVIAGGAVGEPRDAPALEAMTELDAPDGGALAVAVHLLELHGATLIRRDAGARVVIPLLSGGER